MDNALRLSTAPTQWATMDPSGHRYEGTAMELKAWEYDEFPEFAEEIPAATWLETTGDEVGVLYVPNVEYECVDGVSRVLQILVPTSRNAPVLTLHGTKDRTVNTRCSVLLHQHLVETGHESQLYLLRGADHGGPEFWTNQTLRIVDDFLQGHLA